MRTMSDDELIQYVEHNTKDQLILEFIGRLNIANTKADKKISENCDEIDNINEELYEANEDLSDARKEIDSLQKQIDNMTLNPENNK